jgi:hypothetical protein
MRMSKVAWRYMAIIYLGEGHKRLLLDSHMQKLEDNLGRGENG